MTETSVLVSSDRHALAESVAARLLVRLADSQSARGLASVVLTGGGICGEAYSVLGRSPARDRVDWSKVDLWWGDERFLPAGHPDRNATQAQQQLLAVLPVDPARVHPMYPSDGPDGDDPEAAAARYAADLARAARPGTAALPHFDVVMLGVGEEGHIASLFPEHPALYDTRTVTAVRGSPKPPPTRLTLTFASINTAEEVWLIAAGTEKAQAVRMALTGPGGVQLPAAGVHGVERTLWMLDRAAAAEVPPTQRSLR